MAEAVCPGHFLIMFSRLGLIRDVRVIMVQGGRPCAGELGLWLFTDCSDWENEYISIQMAASSGGVPGEIWNGEERLNL